MYGNSFQFYCFSVHFDLFLNLRFRRGGYVRSKMQRHKWNAGTCSAKLLNLLLSVIVKEHPVYMFPLGYAWSSTMYWILYVPGTPKKSPLWRLQLIFGGKCELSVQTGLSHNTLTAAPLPSLTMSPGQKLQVGGSKSGIEVKLLSVLS